VKERLRIKIFVLACICPCACSNETDDSSQDHLDNLANSQFQEPRGGCAPTDLIGDFKVRLLEENRSFAVTGEVRNGVLPTGVPIEVSAVGDCRITKMNNPFCEELCTGGAVCDNNGGQSEVGRCVDGPLRQNLGNVFVDGLTQPIVMMPDVNNEYSDDSLPYPGYEPGSEIKPLDLSKVKIDLVPKDCGYLAKAVLGNRTYLGQAG